MIAYSITTPPVLGGVFPSLLDFFEDLNRNPVDLIGALRRLGVSCEPEDEPIIPKTDNFTVSYSLYAAHSKNKTFMPNPVMSTITRVSVDNYLVYMVNEAYAKGLVPDYLMLLCNLVWECEEFQGNGYQQIRLRFGQLSSQRGKLESRSEAISFLLTMYVRYGAMNNFIQVFINRVIHYLPERKRLMLGAVEGRFDVLLIGRISDYQSMIAQLFPRASITVATHAAYMTTCNTMRPRCHTYLLDEQGEDFYGNINGRMIVDVEQFAEKVVCTYRLRKLRALLK